MRTIQRILSATALLCSLASIGHATTVFVDDVLSIYSTAGPGVGSTFSNQPGSGALEMAFDTSGNLFVAARDSNAIYEYSPGGVQTLFASVTDPYGLAIDTAGNIYTGASFGDTLEKFAPGGGAPTVIANSTNVQALASDASGNIFEEDGAGNTYIISAGGTRTLYASGGPSGLGIAVDGSGDLYESDWTNFTIDKYTPGSGWSTFGSMPTNQLSTSLIFDASGILYAGEVANGVSSCCVQDVYAFTSAGVRSTFATGFYVPYAIAIDSPEVPEPGSLALVASGALLLALLRKKLSRS